MEKRTDIHRPSVIKPEDYNFVAIIFHGEGIEAAMMNAEERKRLVAHIKATGGKFSTHAHGGSCHICGAHAATLGYFHHVPSNEYIVTGETCCEKLEEGHADKFRAIRDEATAILKAKAGKMKAKALLEESGLYDCWLIFDNMGWFDAENLGYEEGVIWDIVSKLVKYGSISEKQEGFLKRLLDKIVKREELREKREAEKDAAAPCPEFNKRDRFEGKILSLKEQEGFGYYDDPVLKCLVQHASGWKAWGSVPKALRDDIEKGDIIKFEAAFEVSKDDNKFSFFKRPTKAEILVKGE